MKTYNVLFLLVFVILSCEHRKELAKSVAIDKVVTKLITKEKRDTNFELKNGILYYNGDPYSGVLNEGYDNGKLKSSSVYKEGERSGFYKGWYPKGNKWFERYYINNAKTGIHLGWYDNKVKMFEYQFNTKGEYDGYVKNWYPNGVLAKHFIFEKGKETGTQKMWNDEGKIKANFYTVNGERHGLIGLKKCVSVLETAKNKI